MLFFTYMSMAIMDTISITFVIFAIDKDNGVDMSNSEFANEIVKEVPGLVTQLGEGAADPAAGKVVEMQPAAGQQQMVMQPMQGYAMAQGQPVQMAPTPVVNA